MNEFLISGSNLRKILSRAPLVEWLIAQFFHFWDYSYATWVFWDRNNWY